MGKQINYYMEYEAFLSIAKHSLDLNCLIVKEDKSSGLVITSSDISIVTPDTPSYYFYIKEAGPLVIKKRPDGSEYLSRGYSETMNAVIEANFCRYNKDYIFRGRLFSQTGYYDENEVFIPRPDIVNKTYDQLVRTVKKIAPYTETSPGYKNYITPFYYELKKEHNLRLL